MEFKVLISAAWLIATVATYLFYKQISDYWTVGERLWGLVFALTWPFFWLLACAYWLVSFDWDSWLDKPAKW